MIIFTIMSNFFDTICAIATPLSTGGIGVIRISGEDAMELAEKYFIKKMGQKRLITAG